MSATAAMEVCFLSGATLAALAPDEFEGKTAEAVKQALAVQIGVIRFKQRLFSEDGSEISDDEVFLLRSSEASDGGIGFLSS